ncbi:MAG: translation initiation inhibitor [bacterium]
MERQGRVCVSSLAGLTFGKYHITAHPPDEAHPFAMFDALAECVRDTRAQIVAQFVFGGSEIGADRMRDLERAAGPVNWPVTWIHADDHSGIEMTGTQAYAVADTPIRSVILDGRVVGSCFADEYAEYCLLGDLLPMDTAASREVQTRSVFEQCEAALRTVGMDFSHVMRTWLYLDGLLDWYDEFNAVRTRFFEERGVFNGLLPASTGIGIANRHGSALVMDAMAIRPKDPRVLIQTVASPLQCPATHYRSSFSRAVEIVVPGHRQLHISGTASIAPDGASVHQGDIRGQIAKTMEVVATILKSRGMDWSNTTRGIAYCKRLEDAATVQRCMREYTAGSLSIALAHADICRPELLFELELDASAETFRPRT